MALAPIVLFVYNRPRHTLQTLNALMANYLANESALFIFADGPKQGATAETLENIKKTRDIIKTQKWCGEVFIVERDENYGLQKSIIGGVTEVVDKHERIIVLEDDIITSKHFLQYMNDALDTYADEQKVISIGALNFFATDKEVGDTFFAPIPDCWGWATWKNRWKLFEPNAQLLLNRLKEWGLINKFNLDGAFNFESMLIDQVRGTISSWAIRWQAVAYLENKLTLYPRYSVTKNIGFGSGGTHGGRDRYSKQIKFAGKRIDIRKIPVEEDPSITEKMIKGYRETTLPAASQKIKSRLRKLAGSIAPPVIANIYRKTRLREIRNIRWFGDFPDWNTAKKQCRGYEDPTILEKTKLAILKVKNGEAAAERDSVLFEKVHYTWPIITHLLKFAIEGNNRLNIIDFGGSLGSSYFQNRTMIPANIKLSWNVVEQHKYISIGNSDFADDKLHFYYTLNEAYKQSGADILLLFSVLQYLEKPYEFLDEVITYGFKYILVDRTAFIDEPDDRITIQKVDGSVYESSYPAWFLNNKKFKEYFSEQYISILEFDSDIIKTAVLENEKMAYWRGYIFQKRQV
jgi:putative methyltransferase (TIGR04325 family)